MKNSRSFVFFCITGLFLLALNSYGQVPDCKSNYEKAAQLYDYGMADSALSVLQPCLEHQKVLKNVPRETSGEIFRLAALACIMLGRSEDANEYITQLLKYQPDYKNNIREDDLEEFKLILNSKSAQPDWILGIMAGTNMPFLSLEKKFSDYDAQENYYKLEAGMGYQFGLVINKTLTRNLSLEAGVGMTQILFKYNTQGLTTGKTQYDQGISYIEIPVLVKYNFNTAGPLKPYLQAGLEGKFSLVIDYKSEQFGKCWYTTSTSSNGSDQILASFLANIEIPGMILGGGFNYQMKSGSLRLDLRYIYNLKNSSQLKEFDAITGYDDIPEEEDFSYTDDITVIHLTNLQVSLGYFLNLKYRVF